MYMIHFDVMFMSIYGAYKLCLGLLLGVCPTAHELCWLYRYIEHKPRCKCFMVLLYDYMLGIGPNGQGLLLLYWESTPMYWIYYFG